jgi:hypothetical protein
LENWADSAFTVGDKDSRGLPVTLPTAAITSAVMLLPPPFNLVASIAVQIGLRILDSKLEAASNRAAFEDVSAVLEEISETLKETFLDNPITGNADSIAARIALGLESLRQLGVTCTFDDFGKTRVVRLDFSGLLTTEDD